MVVGACLLVVFVLLVALMILVPTTTGMSLHKLASYLCCYCDGYIGIYVLHNL